MRKVTCNQPYFEKDADYHDTERRELHDGEISKKIISGLFILTLIFITSGCAKTAQDTENITQRIVIPASYLQFAGADAEDTAESYREYCEGSEVSDQDVVLDVTDRQKSIIMQMNQDYIDNTLAEFEDANSGYSYELADDYSSIVYAYDEKIDSSLQAQLLMGVTSMYALNGIFENNTGKWSVELTVKNCHSGKTVAYGILPEDTLSFGENEWEESY